MRRARLVILFYYVFIYSSCLLMWWPFGFLNVHGTRCQALWVVANTANNYRACTSTCHEQMLLAALSFPLLHHICMARLLLRVICYLCFRLLEQLIMISKTSQQYFVNAS